MVKNKVFKDNDGLCVELFEFKDNGKDLFSFFDCFKTSKQAKRISRVLTVSNQNKIRDKLIENPRYLA